LPGVPREMWKAYSGIARRYPKIPLSEERRLISKAQKGSRLRQACLPARQGFGGQAPQRGEGE